MAARQNDIDINTILIIGGAIILLPILKGLFSAAQTAQDILETPGRLIDKMNAEIDNFALSNAEKIMLRYVESHNYDPNNANDISMMKILKDTHLPNKNFIISKWKEYKSPGKLLGMWAGGQYMVHQAVNDLYNNFF